MRVELWRLISSVLAVTLLVVFVLAPASHTIFPARASVASQSSLQRNAIEHLAAQSNLLTNPNFSNWSGDYPDGWLEKGTPTVTQVSGSSSDAEGAQLETTNDSEALYQNVPNSASLAVGCTLAASADFQYVSGDSSNSPLIEFEITYADGSYDHTEQGVPNWPGTGWMRATLTYPTKSASITQLQFLVVSNTNSEQAFQVSQPVVTCGTALTTQQIALLQSLMPKSTSGGTYTVPVPETSGGPQGAPAQTILLENRSRVLRALANPKLSPFLRALILEIPVELVLPAESAQSDGPPTQLDDSLTHLDGSQLSHSSTRCDSTPSDEPSRTIYGGNAKNKKIISATSTQPYEYDGTNICSYDSPIDLPQSFNSDWKVGDYSANPGSCCSGVSTWNETFEYSFDYVPDGTPVEEADIVIEFIMSATGTTHFKPTPTFHPLTN